MHSDSKAHRRSSGLVGAVTLGGLLALALVACQEDKSEDSACDALACGEHGRCAVAEGVALCVCDPGYVADGPNCIVDPCSASPCLHGTCRASGRSALCLCEPGYAGGLCDGCAPGYRVDGLRCVQGSACEEDPCVYGLCRSEAGQPVCDCFTGYVGVQCDTCAPGYHPGDLRCLSDSPCDPDPCVHGSCDQVEGRAVCTCQAGYAGLYCDECAEGFHIVGLGCEPERPSPCDPNPCQEAGRSVCEVQGEGHRCLCDDGLHEDDEGACVVDSVCDPNPCAELHRSACVDDGAGGHLCDCDPGWHEDGGACLEDSACSPNPCSTVHRTRCEPGDDGPTCLCDAGWHDESGRCVEDSACSPNPCVEEGRGRCRVTEGGHECLCDPGSHDEDGACVPDVACDPATTCSGNGTCTGEGLACSCDDGYAGQHCSECDAGYHSAGEACVADSPCEPNPCDTVHRTVCAAEGQGHTCSCDPGYQDSDGDGTCLADCATAGLDCGAAGACGLRAGRAVCICEEGSEGAACERCIAGWQDRDGDGRCRPTCATAGLDCGARSCDDASGEPACVGRRSCDTVVTYDPAAGAVGALYIRGEFNQWGLTNRLQAGEGGILSATLQLAAGDYGYKLYDQGADRWFEDPGNPYFKWVDGSRNSRLHVPDCALPQIELQGQPTVQGGRVQFRVQYVDGSQGAGLAPASVVATRNDQALGVTFDVATGLLAVDDANLPRGKYAYRFRASDQAGRRSELLYVPVWVEPEAFDWRDAVLYFVLTDRFADGNPGNNAPTANVDPPANWQGGDFAGLRAQVESGYFDRLGVNALWISSISQNTSGAGRGTDGRMYSGYHSYWPITTGWRDDLNFPGLQSVDPHFGQMADFKALVQAAHARGIRVIVDFVANHVHTDSPLWQQHNQDQPAWFHDLYVCGWDRPIECWFASYLPDFDYTNLDVLNTSVEHAIWMIQETDIDGFRLDAVKHMVHAFGYALRARVQESVVTTGERFYMVGETFTGENGAGEIADYIRPQELDGQFDFPLYWAIVATFLREERSFLSLAQMLEGNVNRYGDFAVMSNFLGNHDVARALSHAAGQIGDMWGNGAQQQGWTNPPQAPDDDTAYKRLRMAWTFLMSLPGVPLIYYGDEFGMPGAGDPDNRRFMRFEGLSAREQATLEHVQRLGAARNAHAALRRGELRRLLLDGDGRFYAYGRRSGDDRAVVAFNRNDGRVTRSVPVGDLGIANGQRLRDVLRGVDVTVANGSVEVALDGRESVILVTP